MSSMTIEYVNLAGTGASVGRAGVHTLLADRPEGKASGTGLGFNGGELLALSLGGCFCNDVHYVADELGVVISRLQVAVTVDFEGDPLLARSARIRVNCELATGESPDEVLSLAWQRSTVANSLRRGFDIVFQ